MSRIPRKPDFCIYENKGVDRVCGNPAADQRLCFCFIDRTMSLLPKIIIWKAQGVPQ